MGYHVPMELLKTWISQERGRASRLAKELDVPYSFVHKMAVGIKSIPIAHAAQVERITEGAVTRKAIRPNDWSVIWPELRSD